MSSTPSNPDDGDSTEQSQLGLDTVIQVSEVAVPSLTPEEQVLRALLDRTALPLPTPAPKSTFYLCTCVLSVNMSVQVWISSQAKQLRKPAPLWSSGLATCTPRWKGRGRRGSTVLVARYGSS